MRQNPTPEEFSEWITEFRRKALRSGISGRVYDRAMSTVFFDDTVVQKDRFQPEHTQTIWEYLDRAVSEQRVQNGLTAIQSHGSTLDRIVARYGVPAELLCAIWGLESAYGTIRGDFPVIQSLATLACDGRRAGLFETQLIAALTILQVGDISSSNMLGSWAGAMGHTQFMPSSFLDRAVDFDGDGRRDIWGDDPCDALASTARYLCAAGWQTDAPVMVEVNLDAGFDFAQVGLGNTKPAKDWAQIGIQYGPVWDSPASVLVPAGAGGPAFMVFSNFNAILEYNRAIPYALAVAHLADRIGGAGGLNTDWPLHQKAMNRKEQTEFQEKLSAQGFDTQGSDGIFGPNTFSALRSYQAKNGLVADGFPTREILQLLRE